MTRSHRIAFALLALVLLLSVLDAAPARAFYNEGSQVPLTWSGRCYDPDNDLAVHPISGMTNAEALASLPRLTLDSAWFSAADDHGYEVVIPGSAYNGERIFVFPAGTAPAEVSSVNVADHPAYITLSETTLYAVDVYLVSGGEGSWLMSDEAAALAAEGSLVYEAEVAPAFEGDNAARGAWWAAFLADHPEVEGVIGVQTTPVSVFDGVANVSEGGWLGGIPSLCVFPAAPPTTTTTTTTTTTPPATTLPTSNPPTTAGDPCAGPDPDLSQCLPATGPTLSGGYLALSGVLFLAGLLLLVGGVGRPLRDRI